MHKLICDFCQKEIRPSENHLVVNVETSQTILGSRWDVAEFHYHLNCGTLLRDKINQFILEKREEQEIDDRSELK